MKRTLVPDLIRDPAAFQMTLGPGSGPGQAQKAVGPGSGPGRRNPEGFTLIELVCALAIFALMAGFAYRSLTSLLESREALERESQKWRDMALFIGRVERDLASVVNRRGFSSTGALLPPVSSTLDTARGASDGIALLRAGMSLAQGMGAAPQRVGYRLADGKVELLSWTAPDSAPRSSAEATPILSGVRALEFRFMAPTGEWRTTWGAPGTNEGPPQAVSIELQLESGEKVRRVIDLPAFAR
jgi:general secretion pathway protein J